MLQNKDIINSGPIGDWIPFEDSMSGVLEWHRKDNNSVIVYATPHWEIDGLVPVAMVTEDGDNYTDIMNIELSLKQPVDFQLNEYISEISEILSVIK